MKYQLLLSAILAMQCLSALSAATDAPASAVPAKPNIIFILTDDQGYGDLSAHGHPLLKTPNFDRMYHEGVRFDNFYVSPSCSPTRAALLTGMHEFRSGVTHTRDPREQLHKDAVTLPELLKKSGYRTALIGKWHLGGNTEKGYRASDRGFDLYSNVYGDLFDGLVHHNEKLVRKVPGKFREDIYFDEAMRYIEECGDKPYFCEIATISPHTPLGAPEKFIAPFRGKVSDEEATYLGMVANLDYNIGRLMDFLAERKLDKNTIVVLMNDNGQTCGLDVYNAGMRGCKTTAWQGGSRSFSFWRWPGQWTPHRVDNLTAHLDFLPTICELTGTPISKRLQSQLEGFSLVPLLKAKGPLSWHDERMVFLHTGRWPSGMAATHKYAKASVLQGHFILVRNRACDDPACSGEIRGECDGLRAVEKGSKVGTYTKENAQFHWGVTPPGRWALYDLKKDIACQNDIAEKNPDRVKAMAAAYDKWWDDLYPVMIKRGGDRELLEMKNKRAEESAKTRCFFSLLPNLQKKN
ncbi:MAG: arylsulfatase [Spartobacteria bacterium]|nr:arylsulfatase [Spartobacteria bacterium]